MRSSLIKPLFYVVLDHKALLVDVKTNKKMYSVKKALSLKVFAVALVAVVAYFGWSQVYALAEGPARVQVIIGFTSLPQAADEAMVKSVGGEVRHTFHLIPAMSVVVPESAVAGISKNPRVEYIEYDGTLTGADMELDDSWGVKRVNAGVVHASGTTGVGVKVAVIDSGIDLTHPDLAANYAGGYDFVNNDTNPADDLGHGTHVAGIVAALDNNTGVVGVAPGVQLYALKVLNAENFAYWSDVVRAVEWAVDNGIQITNTSLVGAQGSLAMKDAYDASYALGMFHVASAGNSGTCDISRKSTVTYPAKYDSLVAVGATTQTDTRPCWSSTGSEVELSAPGEGVRSTYFSGTYASMNGTSMASPHVAGAAALLIAAGITDANGNGFINDDIRLKLRETSVDIGANGLDKEFGYGLIDAASAVASISDPGTGTTPTEVSVSSLTYNLSGSGKNRDRNLDVVVRLVDDLGAAVGDAQINLEVKLDGVVVKTASVITDSTGTARTTITNAASGCYVTTILSVVGTPLTWDTLTPANQYCK